MPGMSRLLLSLCVVTIGPVALGACGGPLGEDDPCGLGVERPELTAASARYNRDGQQISTTGGGHKLEFPHDLVIGSLTMNIKQDRDRRLVTELVEVSAFPICVPLDGSEDGSGWALLEDGEVSYSTTDQRTGMVAILALDGESLIGRFAFEAEQNAGAGSTRVEDGIFNLLPR